MFDFESASLARRCSSSREFDVYVCCTDKSELYSFFSFLFADTSRFYSVLRRAYVSGLGLFDFVLAQADSVAQVLITCI